MSMIDPCIFKKENESRFNPKEFAMCKKFDLAQISGVWIPNIFYRVNLMIMLRFEQEYLKMTTFAPFSNRVCTIWSLSRRAAKKSAWPRFTWEERRRRRRRKRRRIKRRRRRKVIKKEEMIFIDQMMATSPLLIQATASFVLLLFIIFSSFRSPFVDQVGFTWQLMKKASFWIPG